METSVVPSFKSPLRKKSPVTSWADEADTDDDEENDDDLIVSGSGSPKKKRSGGLAQALGKISKSPSSAGQSSAASTSASSPRRGWESASVTRNREQSIRASASSIDSTDASSAPAGGKWADVVKQQSGGGGTSGPVGSANSKARESRDGVWQAGDSGSSTTAGSDPSESDSGSWGDQRDTPVLPVNTRAALFASATGAQPAKRETNEEKSSWGDSR